MLQAHIISRKPTSGVGGNGGASSSSGARSSSGGASSSSSTNVRGAEGADEQQRTFCWTLLALVIGVFPPSPAMVPYVVNLIRAGSIQDAIFLEDRSVRGARCARCTFQIFGGF
jgi:hypothetical protein